MISFNLGCGNGHSFEGWFASGADFEAQKERGLVECPQCGDRRIDKALMAPAVATSRSRESALSARRSAAQEQAIAFLREMVRAVRENPEDVGDRVAEQARRIHYGETEPRGIYGQATPGEVRSLAEEGIAFVPLPALPEDHN